MLIESLVELVGDLKEHGIVEVILALSPEKRSRGFGFVKFDSPENCSKFLENKKGLSLKGCELVMNLANDN